MKSTKRARRRHHGERMRQRALRSVVLSSRGDMTREDVGRWYNNLQKCSCYMCGNPRRYFGGPTRQERRLLAAALANAS